MWENCWQDRMSRALRSAASISWGCAFSAGTPETVRAKLTMHSMAVSWTSTGSVASDWFGQAEAGASSSAVVAAGADAAGAPSSTAAAEIRTARAREVMARVVGRASGVLIGRGPMSANAPTQRMRLKFSGPAADTWA